MENILVVSALEPQRKKKDRYNIYVDGEYAASLGAESCVVYGIKSGCRISEDDFNAAVASDNTRYAFDSAVSLLSFKMRTKNELAAKLQDKGINEDAIAAAIEKLKSYGYIDDKAYAAEFVQSAMLAEKYGKKVVEYKLKQKGIDENVIEDVMQTYTYDIEKDIAAKQLGLLRKRYAGEDTAKKRHKTFSALARRGFDYEIVNTLLSEEEEY